MAEQSTYIKIDRNIERWRWWQKGKTLHVFLFLLLNANVVDREFEHKIVHRGQVATSLGSIVKSTGLTLQEVRTAILHLKSTGEITTESCNRYQVITIVNYNAYQDVQQSKQQRKQQAINRQSTGNQQQYKNIKNVSSKEKRIPPKSPKGDFTPSEKPERGTDAFRNQSHLLLKPDEGTMDDIPVRYKDQFKTFADYWGFRNQ